MPFFCPIAAGTPVEPSGIDDPAGSGPYYVAERVPNRRLTLRRNPYYRGGRPANLDEVTHTIGVSDAMCVAAAEQDKIDTCENELISTAALRSLADKYGVNRPGGRFYVAPSLSTWWFAFNHDREAFRGAGQIPLKKAINFAIDRPALARSFGYLAARRTAHLLPPAFGRPGTAYPIRGADPSTARKWLEKARTVPGKLVLYTFNTSLGVELGQVFTYDLRQLGIDVDVKYFSPRALFDKTGTRGEPFDVAVSGWLADYADASAFYRPLLAKIGETSNTNNSYFSDAGVSRRMEAADRLSGADRVRAWMNLDADLMRDNPPWAPFVNNTSRVFVSRSVGCFFVHPVYSGLDIPAVCKK
jgi:ABC-type oligopeptide transport system substrate-binding subunit